MTDKPLFTLDTNILVYAFARDQGERHDKAAALLRDARTTRRCILTVQALAELFHVLTRKSMASADRARFLVEQLAEAFPVAQADSTCLLDAMDAVCHDKWAFWDAMIWATARRAGCRFILTEDGQAGRTLLGVTLLNPFAEPRPSALVTLLA
ncbi:PIN domain-containing protein [Caenispirillum bisanense]|uniref:PIN domain-containing protein n=1 Tax=Caenispirillum bisanense TaxID=414052 RepID=UPI0031E36D36